MSKDYYTDPYGNAFRWSSDRPIFWTEDIISQANRVIKDWLKECYDGCYINQDFDEFSNYWGE